MDESEAVELAQQAVGFAGHAGAQEAEASVSVVRRFHVEARDKTIVRLEESTGKSLHLRAFCSGRTATLTTSDLTPDGLQAAIARTIAQAAFVAVDRFAALPDGFATDGVDLELYDPAVVERANAAKVDDVLALEREIRAVDARIVNSSGSHYTDAASITAIANSAGYAASYTSTRVGRSTGPVAIDGTVKRTTHYGTAARYFAELEGLEPVARTAAERTVSLLGARKPPTMRVPVLFERDVAAALLEDVFAAVSAANVAVGNSWLVGRIGARIGSDRVTIVDDGRLPGKLGSSPFDGEGVATRRTPVFESGVLRTFLYDTYYARKLGAASTGNSTGHGVGTNSFYLQAGTMSLDDLIAGTPKGVLVLDMIGFATEHASGTFSRGARGFFIEGGELTSPIDEFTIAGTYADILAGIDAVANDLRFDAAVVSPSLRVAEMTVSGN